MRFCRKLMRFNEVTRQLKGGGGGDENLGVSKLSTY